MKKRNLLNKILAGVLILSMTFNVGLVSAFAEPIPDIVEFEGTNDSTELEATNNITDVDNISEDILDEKMDESDLTEGSKSDDKNMESTGNELTDDNGEQNKDTLDNTDNVNESNTETEADDIFYRELTEDEIDVKQSVEKELEDFDEAKEGKDYAKNEFVMLCDSKEDAEKAGKAYEAALACKVELIDFEYGVATFEIIPIRSKNSENYVENALKKSADIKNNLPAISPNYYYHCDSIDTSSYENYNDPFLKSDSSHNHWYHNIIDDKYVWHKIDNDSDFKDRLSDISVAVIDTGINSDHADFKTPDTVIKADVNMADTTGDKQGHGSNVAGIIGSIANNNIGGRGVSGGVGIVSIGVMDDNKDMMTAYIAKALNYIRDKKDEYNIKAVNMSIGGGYYDSLYATCVSEVYEAGVLVVASAGNDNTYMSQYPSSYAEAMSVASLNQDKEKSSFSNYGTTIDIAAPGGETKVDATKYGFINEQLLWAPGCSEEYDYSDESGVYAGMAGTSQATPVVTATAALIAAVHPEYSPAQIRERLKSTSTKLKSSYSIGAGCVNVADAVGIDTNITPVVRNEEGEILPNKSVLSNSELIQLSIDNEDSSLIEDGVIYYTLNGKNPDPNNMDATGTFEYDGEPITFGGKLANVTIKMKAYLYGDESKIMTYSYSFKGDTVSEIDLDIAGISYEEEEIDDTIIKTYSIAQGKKINITSVVKPASAKNKKLTWSSSNTTVATVSSSGQVTANATGETIITARAMDNGDDSTSESIMVKVVPVARQIMFNVDYDATTCEKGDTLDISSVVEIYPIDSLQKATYSSSNSKVASVNADGTVKALAKGTTTITAMTTDGSALKDTIILNVINPITSMEIIETNEAYFIGAGCSKQLSVAFNEGKDEPYDTSIRWSITDGDEYATIDPESGVIRAASYVDNAQNVTVTAESVWKTELKCEKEISILPRTTSISPMRIWNAVWNEESEEYIKFDPQETTSISAEAGYIYYIFESDIDYDENINKESKGVWLEFESSPETSEKKFIYKSSDPGILKVEEHFDTTGNQYAIFTGIKAGKAKLIIQSLDGGNAKREIDVKFQSVPKTSNPKIISKEEKNILYPGKSITFDVYDGGYGIKNNIELIRGKIEKTVDESGQEEEYVSEVLDTRVVCKGLKVTGTNDITNEDIGKQIEIYMGIRIGNTSYRHPIDIRENNSVGIELYPEATSAVTLAEGTSKQLFVGEEYRLHPTSDPYNACQKYYKYKSSKISVAAVSPDGNITAVGPGTADITVTAGDGSGKTAKCKVTVLKPVTDITITSKSGNNVIGAGGNLQLVANVNKDASNKTVSWSLKDSADSAYATLDVYKGKIIALPTVASKKSIDVIATAADGYGTSAEYTVTVCPLTKAMSVDVKSMTLCSEDIEGLSSNGTFVVDAVSTYGTPSWDTFDVTSSNNAIATAEVQSTAAGRATIKVTAHKKGTAIIKVVALDGSKKSVSCSVTVKEPVRNLEISASNGVNALLPGKTVKLNATVNKDASNSKVKWELLSVEPSRNAGNFKFDDANAKITMNKNTSVDEKTTLTFKAEALDGSGVSNTFNVFAYPVSVKEIAVYNKRYGTPAKNDKLCLGESVSTYFSNQVIYDINVTGKDGGITDKEVIVKSSKPAVADVTYNSSDNTITVNSKAIGTTKITVSAADGSGVSYSFNIIVYNQIRDINVTSKNGNYCVSAGSSLQMQAFVNTDATDKTIFWLIGKDKYCNTAVSDSVATISPKGVINVPKTSSVKEATMIYVRAGGNEAGYKVKEEQIKTVWLYPEQTGIQIGYGYANVHAGQKIDIPIKGTNPKSYQNYMVTYKTKGCGRVAYKTTPTAEGTTITVYGIKPGKIEIIATAQDESGKSAKMTVNVIE